MPNAFPHPPIHIYAHTHIDLAPEVPRKRSRLRAKNRNPYNVYAIPHRRIVKHLGKHLHTLAHTHTRTLS